MSREGIQAEVPGLNGTRQVLPANAAPPNQVLGRNQNSTVMAGSATGAASQAVEGPARLVRG